MKVWLLASAAVLASSLHVVQASILVNQNNNDAGAGVVSQSFEASLSSYDSQGADDFTVPAGTVWKIHEVDVTGQFPANDFSTSENVYFYADNAGVPGAAIPGGTYMNVVGTDLGGALSKSPSRQSSN